MKGIKTKDLARLGVLAALACILTMFPQIPMIVGYVHFGDSIIYIAAAFLGPLAGALVGSVGHSLADLLSGYAAFAIATFIIKGFMGYMIGVILYNNFKISRFILAAFVSLVILVLGYFLAEIPMYGIATATHVFISSPIQWLMSVIASGVFLPIINRYRRKIGL